MYELLWDFEIQTDHLMIAKKKKKKKEKEKENLPNCGTCCPARTYIQQLCEDTGCSPEDLPEAMNDREKWRERVRYVHVGGTTR